MKTAIRFGAISAFTALALAATAAMAGTVRPSEGAQMVPSGKGYAVRAADDAVTQLDAAQSAAAAAGQIIYHGGPVMTASSGVNVYVIWYGNWSGNTGTTIVPDFLNNLGGSPYFGINTTYYDSANVHITNQVNLMGQTNDNYSQGTKLSDAKIKTIVSHAISTGGLPADSKGVYFVLTSKDVNETSGFCSQYCGWHTHGSISGIDAKYAFVGDASRCISSCAAQSTSPNGNPGVDGMISVIAHELEEAATDPDLNAWYFSSGNENADQCAWTFGTEYTVANGSKANMKLGSRDFLIQQNWIQAASGKCALHL
jgi:hypothetical protein